MPLDQNKFEYERGLHQKHTTLVICLNAKQPVFYFLCDSLSYCNMKVNKTHSTVSFSQTVALQYTLLVKI